MKPLRLLLRRANITVAGNTLQDFPYIVREVAFVLNLSLFEKRRILDKILPYEYSKELVHTF